MAVDKITRVEVGLTTTGKFTHLSVLLWSLLRQTHKEWDLTIIDETAGRERLDEIPCVSDLLKLIKEEGHQWRVLYGERKGWHYAQQKVLDSSRHLFTWALDEDHALESNVMKALLDPFNKEDTGATGGIYLLAGDFNRIKLPLDWEHIERFNGIIYIKKQGVGYGNNLQMSVHSTLEPKLTQHLIGSLMYRTEVGKKWGFNLDLSYVARTAENDFSYQFFVNGYKLFVVPEAILWHFTTSFYGTMDKKSEEYKRLCDEDRVKFEKRVRMWNT